ncbi:calphotin-like [Ostrinia furnacalis]|uniref:calphotin-like n=1 Tax=Ostrinia furnacalis TaxID=93504 RepID=UPI00103B6A09|nr:calphotin-like [Ostrinia furnacalis]
MGVMRRDSAMIRSVIALFALCGAVQSSVEHGQAVFPVFPVAQQIPPPVVTSASSQYFERTFNRLIAPPVIPVAPAPPVFVQPTPNAVPIAPSPSPGEPVQPNIAIAVATAHAAAPVATILLPPYPFGPPPTIGFIPPSPPINVPDESRKESTTQPTTKVETKATTRQPEATTPLPASSDNSFSQALPSNQNINFKQFYGPPPQLPPQMKPQKVKTSVEIVPVPLTYIAPPPLKLQAVKTVKHYHTYVPLKSKLIIRPVHSHSHPIRIVRRPVRLVHRVPLSDRIGSAPNVRRPMSREIEPTTFSPFVRSATKPPRV